MKTLQLFVVPLLIAAVSLAGCGSEGPAKTGPAGLKTASIEPDLGKLVPLDAVALVYLANPTAFETKVKQLVTEIDPEAGAEMSREMDLAKIGAEMLPGASQYWDRTRPCAIAVSLPAGGGNPMEAIGRGQGITFIFPMTDIESARTGMEAQLAGAPAEQRPQLNTSGSYLAFSPSPKVLWGDKVPAIAERAPAGDIAIRLDLGSLVTRFREQIDDAMGGMEEMMGQGLEAAPPKDAAAVEGMLGGLKGALEDFVDSADMLEIGAEINGSVADLHLGFSAKAGSKLDVQGHDHGDLAALAAHLPDGFPANILLRMDYAKLMEWLGPLMESAADQMPGLSKEQWKAYLDEAMDMSKLIGPNFAISLGATEKGLQLVEIADIKDAKSYEQRLEKLLALASDMPWMSIEKSDQATMIAGIEVDAYDMTFDFAKLMESQPGGMPAEAEAAMDKVMQRLFGGEKMRMYMASVGRKIIVTMGDTAHMEAVVNSVRGGKGKAAPGIASALAKCGGKPAFVLQMELRQLLSQVMAMAGDIAGEMGAGDEVPSVPSGAPVPVVIWGAHDGRHYSGGLSVDVGGCVRLFGELDR